MQASYITRAQWRRWKILHEDWSTRHFFQLDIYLGIGTSLLVKLAEQADVSSFIAIVTEIPH